MQLKTLASLAEPGAPLARESWKQLLLMLICVEVAFFMLRQVL